MIDRGEDRGVLFLSYEETISLFKAKDALDICENVYRMQKRDEVVLPNPSSLKLDIGAPFHNHWHLKTAFLKDPPITGVRVYNYIDDGHQNNVGSLERLGYVILSDPFNGRPLAIIDDHWTYGLRSAAAPIVAAKWLAPAKPKILALVGIGTMGASALICLMELFSFTQIRCTSRREETRNAFTKKTEQDYGVECVACTSVEETVYNADIVIGSTTSSDVMCRESWLKPGALFISLARREMAPHDWQKMDKVVVDSWDLNMTQPVFRNMVETGLFLREWLHGEIADVVCGNRSGRTREDEKILIHTGGLVSQDIACNHHVYLRALAEGKGLWLPRAHPINQSGGRHDYV